MKKTTTRTTVIVLLLVLAVVGYYAYLSNKSRAGREDVSMTAIEKTLSRDLERDYPPTPKEVIKYYNEILRCLYNEDNTEEDVRSLGMKARELYDEELLEANELGGYLVQLQADVDSYKENGRRITSCNVASSANTELFQKNGYSFAKIMCGYNILQNGQNFPSSQMYLLRKDADKKWKIYGWEDVANLRTGDQ